TKATWYLASSSSCGSYCPPPCWWASSGCTGPHRTCMSGSLGSGSWYGAIGREPGWYGGSQTKTTPLLFSQVPGPGGHHHSLYSTPQT
ncbi:GPR137 isoform 6, partial [Pan troglodytes]